MHILSEILEAKRARVEAAKRQVPPAVLQRNATLLREGVQPHRLRRAVETPDRVNIIAEFKRRSPSRGTIRVDRSAGEIAQLYRAGGAVAVSVLTEQDYFGGTLDDLSQVRRTVSLPVLRKDFIFEEYQVFEAAVAGADAVLLIVAALNDEALLRLRHLAEAELGLDALVEVHTVEELERAMLCGAKLIGVNNRDLTTFEVSLNTSEQLAVAAPEDVVLISESGLRTSDDLSRLRALGYSGFLIGEALMLAEHPEEELRALVGDFLERSDATQL